MFLHLSVILFTEGSLSRGGVSVQRRGLCPEEGSLSRGGVFVQRSGLCLGVSVHGVLCPRGLSVQGASLSGGVSVQGDLCPGGSLFKGVSVQMVSVQGWGGGLCQGDPPVQ